MRRKIAKDDICYVTATCKGCKTAFMIEDSIKHGMFNDEPPRNFYCPACENKRKKKSPIVDFLDKNNITDKIVRREFVRICKSPSAKHRRKDIMLKEAIEVSKYYKESEN